MIDHYFKIAEEKVEIKGQFQIIFNVLKKYLVKTLEMDKQFAPFIYTKGELAVNYTFPISPKTNVYLGGYIGVSQSPKRQRVGFSNFVKS